MKIIIGASWATAEYSKQHELNGPGFGHYMALHDIVLNLATGGLTDDESLERLSVFLQSYKFNPNSDKIFWVVNCPQVRVEDIVATRVGLIHMFENQLNKTFQQANNLAQQHGTVIQCIGGLCDLVPEGKYSNFCNLNIVVPSWGQLLDPSYYSDWLTPSAHAWGHLGKILRQQRPDLLEEWLTVANNITKKETSWKSLSSSGFSTDGSHPDRYAHRVLRDYLFPQWKHKI